MDDKVQKGIEKGSDKNLIVIIPAFNEDLYIGSVVLKALRYASTVLVIDDGSVDETRSVAEAAGARVIAHSKNKGKGAALNTGLAAVRELDPDIVIFLDADGQHDPKSIPQLATAIFEEGADIAIGSRFLDLPNRASNYRKTGQKVVTLFTNRASGVPVSDTWSGYRALSRHAVELIHFRESGWGIEPELQFQAHAHDLKIIDVAVDISYHQAPKRNMVAQGLQTLSGIFRLIGRYRPLLAFFGFGLSSLMCGIFSGLWVVHQFIVTDGGLAFGIALASITLVVLGMLTLYTALTLTYLREAIIMKNQKPDDFFLEPDMRVRESTQANESLHKY